MEAVAGGGSRIFQFSKGAKKPAGAHGVAFELGGDPKW
jgi:hypothetical protein